MTQDESVVTVMQVKNMALALRDAREQRDKLREALQDMMLGMDPERHAKARAALKATEGE